MKTRNKWHANALLCEGDFRERGDGEAVYGGEVIVSKHMFKVNNGQQKHAVCVDCCDEMI